MIADIFFTTTITIKRHQWSNDSSSLVTQSSIKGHIQVGVAKHYTETQGLQFTKPYTLYCPRGSNIAEKDEINGAYIVKYIMDWNVGDGDDHLECLLEKI